MAQGAKILAKIMEELKKEVKPGIATKELDRLAESLILKSGAKPSFKGYKSHDDSFPPFPSCLCASINEQIVHAVPSERILKEGDIVSLDLGILHKGFHADMAVTLAVRRVKPEAQRLIKATKEALEKGIEKVRPGNTFGDVSNAIQEYIESEGFSVVQDLCGHGIGRELHEDPQILNYGEKKSGPEIVKGMVFCLEPMAAIGDGRIKETGDGYSFQTIDDSLSCHFEHTIVVTEDGCDVLTR